jgi:16S rRNA (cytosine1402-N4)-methyltransferase
MPGPRGRIDPCTRVFQGLRIAVNDELGELERLLERVHEWVRPDGRFVVISFHSLEDRMVKHFLRDSVAWEVLTRKVVTATETEQEGNPRSRSAKLRAARRRSEAEETRERNL